MGFREVRTLYLTYQQVAEYVQRQLELICRHPVPCRVIPEEYDQWAIGFMGYRMPRSEVYQVLERIDADKETRECAFPTEAGDDVGDIGYLLARKLLSRGLGLIWHMDISDDEGIWLIEAEPASKVKRRMFTCGDISVDLNQLMSKEETLNFIENEGGKYDALTLIGDQYSIVHGNQLFWHFPLVTDNLLAGTYILLVKEGALALPYNLIDDKGLEEFCLEDAELFDAESIDLYIDEWNTHSKDLVSALSAIRGLLLREQAQPPGKSA